MPADEVRARYLRDRVLTATPAQRVVMLYDRLRLDLTLAQAVRDDEDVFTFGTHIGHALQVVVELQTSLDASAGGPADNLASIYSYLITELIAIRGGALERLGAIAEIVSTLRDAWAQAAEHLAPQAGPAPATAGAWVG